MKILFKLGLLASTLLMAATSAYAITPTSNIGATTLVREVPEPTTLGLLGLGIVILALVRRKK